MRLRIAERRDSSRVCSGLLGADLALDLYSDLRVTWQQSERRSPVAPEDLSTVRRAGRLCLLRGSAEDRTCHDGMCSGSTRTFLFARRRYPIHSVAVLRSRNFGASRLIRPERSTPETQKFENRLLGPTIYRYRYFNNLQAQPFSHFEPL